MSNLLLFPIIIPVIFATVLMLFPKKVHLQRLISIIAAVLTFISGLFLLAKVSADGVQAVTLGSWPAPFGISMVSDMLSVMLVLSSSLITLFVLLYSIPTIGVRRERSFYYPAVLFLMVGVNGAVTPSATTGGAMPPSPPIVKNNR